MLSWVVIITLWLLALLFTLYRHRRNQLAYMRKWTKFLPEVNQIYQQAKKENTQPPTLAEVASRLVGKHRLSESPETVRKGLSKEIHGLETPQTTVTETNNGQTVEAKGQGEIKTLEAVLNHAKVDLKAWTVERYTVNKWDTHTAEGNCLNNWQIKVWLVPNKQAAVARACVQIYDELLTRPAPNYSPAYKDSSTDNNLLELNIFDLHLGKLSWAPEVGENYDLKIAGKRFTSVLLTLLHRARGYTVSRILFPVGNDFFHTDNASVTTTNGTQLQNEDGRWQKVFRAGLTLIVDSIELLRKWAPVDVLIIPGNHDFTKTFYLGETLAAWYRGDKRVWINNSPNPRKYYHYGQVLLGFTHGDKEKIDTLGQLMAHEAPKQWAVSKYREFHLGHQHRKLMVQHVVKSNLLHEELGVTVRSLSSLAGTDLWHHSNGFIGPHKAAEGFIWHPKEGLLGTLNVNINLHED
jgi:hypothetical protein